MTLEEYAKLREQYNQLTPENKRKVKIKCLQLLNAQEGREVEQKKYYYFFDCLDAALTDKYWTAAELNEAMNGAADSMPEKAIKRIAHNYEATLYRYEFNEENNPINEAILYDPFDM